MKDRVPMRQTTCQDGTECWEANVVPGEEIQYIIVTNMNLDISHSCEISPNITPEAGKVHTITITANSEGTQTIDLSTLTDTREIADNGTYYVTGTGQYGIRVTGGGEPDIHLEDARISVSSGNAISITDNASPTIHVVGDNNTVQCTGRTRGQEGAGIYVAQGSTVTITGSSTEDKLTAIGGGGGAGIGGYYLNGSSNFSCGDIYISNVTVTARGSGSIQNDYASGIGAAGSATVGSINISNAVVYVYGTGSSNYGAAAIGGGISSTSVTNKQTEFSIIISDSEVYATRGSSSASYIGMAGDRLASPANYNIISTAHITNSTIYNESGTEITQ